jgi:succinate dehydrogenase flavin-adding protein (antitoxin of CptAB toxin-antitoxin module)
MSGYMGLNEIDRSEINFWEKEWHTLSEEQKTFFCKLIDLKNREQEREFLAVMAYKTHKKELGL